MALSWPQEDVEVSERVQHLGELACDVADEVARRGWSLIQMPHDEILRDTAVIEAHSLPSNASLRKEFMPDYLGHEGSSRVCMLQEDGRSSGSDPLWALPELDAELTAFCKVLAKLTPQSLGFTCAGRRKGMVWTQQQELQLQALSEEDVDAGVLDSHLQFIQHRKLCLMRWISNEGGKLELFPRPNLTREDRQACTLPLSEGKLLIFQADEFGFSYQPLGKEPVALTTWVLSTGSQVVQQLATGYFGVDAVQHSEALGIFVGPPMPTGHRMHVMAMHAHLPGGALDLEGAECMLTSGTDGFVQIPSTRFDVDVYCTTDGEKTPGLSYVRHAAMMSDQEIMNFDNTFFGIREDEVMTMSPNQRMILEDGYFCLRTAGFTKKTLNGRQTAAFLGDTGTDWDFFSQIKRLDTPLVPWKPHLPYGNMEASHLTYGGVSKIVSAGRLSHVMGLRGGSTNIDTACSASLVGVTTACQGLRKGAGGQIKPVVNNHGVDAICMGINMLTSPMPFIGLCGPSMLAVKGRCFTFDVSAEGYARGDGFGAVYIKPSNCDQDYLDQLCTLMGTYVNQDGRSATLTAPNGMAQQACIRESMREAMVTASQITIAECHGTGTALGDPIEVGALRGVMEPRDTPLLTTSAKSNIGHTEACAGMIGLIKCVSMVANSQAHPNCHLHMLNPHLDVDGFPSNFDTEVVDTRLNSNYAGVSSFGFSGTNARADVWSQCKSGPRKANTKPDISKADQVHMRCPVTLGPIEATTGEPVTQSFKKRKAYKADVLRDEWASYDISAQAYTGGYRYRRRPLQDSLDDLEDVDIYICGSWSGWTQMEPMQSRGAGRYVAPVILGDACYEMFRLCLNLDRSMEIYPIIKDASSQIWIEGPDSKCEERYWIIDGRHSAAASGTLYEVEFQWHPDLKAISWQEMGASLDLGWSPPAYEHSYMLLGSFTAGHMQPMNHVEGVWRSNFRLGVTGEEEFQISRDGDLNQLIYPAQSGAVKTTVPARGPDSLGREKFWMIRGMPGEKIEVLLEVVEGHVRVTVSSEVRGDKTWDSEDGWERHSYYAYASWSGWVPVPMVMDPSEPGVFRAYGKVQASFAPQYGCHVERFFLIMDEDMNQALYPQLNCSEPFQYVMEGPSGNPSSLCWHIQSRVPDARFEVILDLTAEDYRHRVSWVGEAIGRAEALPLAS
ncbi:unnamed protein product [Effrenium voratum]|nr:unnamed protein product [Effrenium voratum]